MIGLLLLTALVIFAYPLALGVTWIIKGEIRERRKPDPDWPGGYQFSCERGRKRPVLHDFPVKERICEVKYPLNLDDEEEEESPIKVEEWVAQNSDSIIRFITADGNEPLELAIDDEIGKEAEKIIAKLCPTTVESSTFDIENHSVIIKRKKRE